MKNRWTYTLAALGVLLLESFTQVQSQGLMGGFKGHNRGTGAVELLLATGILAKLLNFRNKHGAHMGRHLLHALIGPRYPASHLRYPLDMPQVGAHPLLQDDLLEQHASMSSLSLNDADLMLNQESALLASRAPLLMSPSMLSESSLLAEAQLGQQLLAARKARKILEAKKLLAAQEASSLLAAQSEAAHYLANHDGFHTHGFLADQSKQVYTALPAPKQIPQRTPNLGQAVGFPNLGSSNSGHGQNGFVGSNVPPQYQGIQGQQNSGHQNSYHGNPGPQINFNQGNPGHQINFNQGNPGLQGNFQGNSAPQNNYHGNSIPQGNYQGNIGSQDFQPASSDNGMMSSASSSHYHSVPFRQPNNYGPQGNFRGNSGQRMSNFMTPEEARHLQSTVARADDVLTLPPGFDDEDAAQIIAGLQ
ncbi:hypothetical protein HNY73_020154 [Argiope bruennichi]|uniref:Uncharacterized protein n=1 Tax=Argiope bruennichi TaxID=94029 RepID=A0A8T0E5V9_ARGBR|nr:hypothetical protein HNY73_020154 [Argiope bruennichi]